MINSNKKIIVFYVYEILKEYTDSFHFLTQKQIQEKIYERYYVKPNVKTIASNIDALIDAGYEIKKMGNKGCYLAYRNFDNGELLFLVDAINSSKDIATDHAKDLINRLVDNCSRYEKNQYKYVFKSNNFSRVKNKQLFFVIEKLSEAVEKGKKIAFIYNEYDLLGNLKPRKEGKKYIVSPYFLANSRGNYYLVCNHDKFNDISNYKIELITDVQILDDGIRNIKKLDVGENFSIQAYIDEHIYMMSGKSVNATIKLSSPNVINDVIDWYGGNFTLENDKENVFIKLKVNERALVYWALQYGEYVQIIKPESTIKQIKKLIVNLDDKYK